jgi:putative membrane protein
MKSLALRTIAWSLSCIAVFGGTATPQQPDNNVPTTAQLIARMAMLDGFIVQTSKVVALKLQEPGLKKFANQMIVDHTATLASLKQLAQDTASQFPTSLNASHSQKVRNLQSLNGPEMEKQYLSDAQQALQDEAALMQPYLRDGDNENAKMWTRTTLSVLERHLMMSRDLQK